MLSAIEQQLSGAYALVVAHRPLADKPKPRLRYNWTAGHWAAVGVAYGGVFRAATQADAANKSLRTYIAVDHAAGRDLTATYPAFKIQRS